jgi:hypothetical protein
MGISVTSNKSILWNDSVLQNDRVVVAALVDKIVSGGDAHKLACVDKIILNIQTQNWQKKFRHRIFVFSAYYALEGQVVEIKFALYCQVVDAFYYTFTGDPEVGRRSFDYKIRAVFREVYGHEMKSAAANLIRIVRNNVMHTGSIVGMLGRNKPKDDAAVEAYRVKHGHHDEAVALIHIASDSNYLVSEIIVRVLGLEWVTCRLI